MAHALGITHSFTHSLIHLFIRSFNQLVSQSIFRQVSLCVKYHGSTGDATVNKTNSGSFLSWRLYSNLHCSWKCSPVYILTY